MMNETHYNTAYIIAGQVENGRVFYYGYDFENNIWTWFPSAIEDSNLFLTVEDAKTFKRHIKDDKNMYSHIKRIWIEKLTTLPIPEDTAEEL